MKQCKHGHTLTENNKTWYVHTGSGSKLFVCRQCKASRARLKYRTDGTHRNVEKVRSRQNYAKDNLERTT